MAPRRSHARFGMMNLWSKTALALGIFLSLAAVVSKIGDGWRVPWKQDQLAEQVKLLRDQLDKWRVDTHEARLTVLEEQGRKLMDGQEEQRKATSALKDSIANVGSDLRAGMVEIKTIVNSMASGVDNAQRIALRAESLVIDHNVQVDFRDNAVQSQPQPKFGK